MATASVLVEPPLEIELIVETITPNPCGGPGNVGAIDVSVINGCPPYTFTWSSNVPGFVDPHTEDISGLVDGEYYVTVTDSNVPANTTTEGPLVIVTEVLNVTGTVQNFGCNGLGAIYTNVTGGTAPYQYIWSNGQVSENIYNLQPGSYTVTVIDAYSCTDTETFTVINGNVTSLSLVSATNPIYGADGQIVFTVSNSVANNTLVGVTEQNGGSWYLGTVTTSSTITLNDLPPGTYTISYINEFGCQDELVVTLVIQDLPAPVDEIDQNITGVMCCIGKKIAEMFNIYSYGHANIDCIAIPLITMNSMLKSVMNWYPQDKGCWGGSKPYYVLTGFNLLEFPDTLYLTIPSPDESGGAFVEVNYSPSHPGMSEYSKMYEFAQTVLVSLGLLWEIQGSNLFIYWPVNSEAMNGVDISIICYDNKGRPTRAVVALTKDGFIGGKDDCCWDMIGTSVCLSEDEAAAMLNQLKCNC